MRLKPKTRIVLLLIGFSFVYLLIHFKAMIPNYRLLFWNTSASLPRGLYLALPALPGNTYKIGDLVVYEPPADVQHISVANGWSLGQLFVKKIGALENDEFSIDDNRDFKINGVYIGKAAEENDKGIKLPQLRGKFRVSSGSFLPVTMHERSFDGRYTGTVPLKAIKAKVIPILTEYGEY